MDESFFKKQIDGFLTGYFRNFMTSQPHNIEIIGEKNTIEGVIKPTAIEFHIPCTLSRIYSSSQSRYKLAQRYEESGKNKLVILILTDHDPVGDEITQSFCRSMRDDFGIENIHPVKVALTREKVNELGLPPIMKAKDTSRNYKKFYDKHGDDAFELEAVPPEKLQHILRNAILLDKDIDTFNREKELEEADRLDIQEQHSRIMNTMMID